MSNEPQAMNTRVGHVHIIKTGGTIEFNDPGYEDINNKLLKIDTSIESYLKNLIQPHFTFSTEELCEKDSRDVTDEDRAAMRASILRSESKRYVITHGTYTMAETAQYLNENGVGDNAVVITGSMIPIVGFAASDAGFNIGLSIGLLQSLEPGVYICMNGGLFGADEVSKNVEKFRFE